MSSQWETGGVNGIVVFLLVGLLFYAGTLLVYRAYLKMFPFPSGPLEPGSQGELLWMVYITFWLLFFYPVVLPRWMPIPMTGWLFRLFGANIGKNSYFGGMIYDPHLVTIGSHVLGGAGSLLIPHVAEGNRVEHHRLQVGNHVTIGAQAIILPGVIIEDHVIIGAGAVIPKNSHLRRGEVWAGNPARRIKTRNI